MKSIKAIVYGCLFVAVVMLFIQFGYIFLAVGYNLLAADYPVLNDISGIFRYLLAIPLFVATLFVAGYLVAATAEMISKQMVLLHCFSVGVISVGGMFYLATGYMSLTETGVIIFILAQVGVVAGGLHWLRGVSMAKIGLESE